MEEVGAEEAVVGPEPLDLLLRTIGVAEELLLDEGLDVVGGTDLIHHLDGVSVVAQELDPTVHIGEVDTGDRAESVGAALADVHLVDHGLRAA